MIEKHDDGWYYNDKGPYPTKSKALQENALRFVNEKRDKNLCVALDYHNTYSADPKFWITFIYMCWMRKWEVYCITHHTGQDQNDKLMDSIGKVLDKDHVIFTMGKAKEPYCKAIGLNIDIWIDNNPEHIIKEP